MGFLSNNPVTDCKNCDLFTPLQFSPTIFLLCCSTKLSKDTPKTLPLISSSFHKIQTPLIFIETFTFKTRPYNNGNDVTYSAAIRLFQCGINSLEMQFGVIKPEAWISTQPNHTLQTLQYCSFLSFTQTTCCTTFLFFSVSQSSPFCI
jgi:hypothetical protein